MCSLLVLTFSVLCTQDLKVVVQENARPTAGVHYHQQVTVVDSPLELVGQCHR